MECGLKLSSLSIVKHALYSFGAVSRPNTVLLGGNYFGNNRIGSWTPFKPEIILVAVFPNPFLDVFILPLVSSIISLMNTVARTRNNFAEIKT